MKNIFKQLLLLAFAILACPFLSQAMNQQRKAQNRGQKRSAEVAGVDIAGLDMLAEAAKELNERESGPRADGIESQGAELEAPLAQPISYYPAASIQDFYSSHIYNHNPQIFFAPQLAPPPIYRPYTPQFHVPQQAPLPLLTDEQLAIVKLYASKKNKIDVVTRVAPTDLVPCPQCGKKVQKRCLKKHIVRSHTLVCRAVGEDGKACDYIAQTEEDYNEHARSHSPTAFRKPRQAIRPLEHRESLQNIQLAAPAVDLSLDDSGTNHEIDGREAQEIVVIDQEIGEQEIQQELQQSSTPDILPAHIRDVIERTSHIAPPVIASPLVPCPICHQTIGSSFLKRHIKGAHTESKRQPLYVSPGIEKLYKKSS